ncbi:phage capsid protein [Aerococcaceae bacterium NML190073]|nr:phage capsid protein [Aerococcaceae bacterium NML190073]
MAENNLQTTTVLANWKAKEIDFTYRFGENFKKFIEALGITRQLPVVEGFTIKMYDKPTVTLADGTVAEGELIPLSKVEPKVAKTKDISLKKYRKSTTGEAIQKYGYDKAVDVTDEAMLKEVQKGIRKTLFDLIQSGEAKTNLKSGTLQGALATAWGALQTVFEDDAVKTVAFVNPQDIATQIANKNVTLENRFGLNYYTDVTGTLVFSSAQVTKGTIYATAPENLVVAYINPSQSDLGKAFELTSDTFGYIGMKHFVDNTTLTHQTLMVSGILMFPERLDGVVKVEIGQLSV